MKILPRMSYQKSSALMVGLERAVCMVWNDRAPPAKTCGSVPANRLLMLLVASVAAFLISVRFYVNCGWADRLLQPGQTLSAYGSEHNLEDSLSYLSWSQQTRLGHFWLSDLYTT